MIGSRPLSFSSWKMSRGDTEKGEENTRGFLVFSWLFSAPPCDIFQLECDRVA